MNMTLFTWIVRKHITHEQIHAILEDITATNTGGYCPICEVEDVPVDAAGNEITGDNVEHADEWREQHDDDCPVTLLELPGVPDES